MFKPASRHMSTRRVASGTSLFPHAAKSSPLPPNVPVPSVNTGTFNPEPPSCLYSILFELLVSKTDSLQCHTTESRLGFGLFFTDYFDLIRRLQDNFRLVVILGDGSTDLHALVLEAFQIPEFTEVVWKNNRDQR